jgi:predicted hydrocarbon binding protein
MAKEDIISEIISKKLLISTDKNFLQLFNSVDISMYGGRAWAFTLQELGIKKNKDYLFEIGEVMGKDAAQEVKEVLEKKKVFLPKEIQILDNIIEATGFGVVKTVDYIPKKEITLEVTVNPTINFGKEMYDADSLVCSFYAGVYSGFINAFLDLINCRLLEKKCICKGDEKCIFSYKNV